MQFVFTSQMQKHGTMYFCSFCLELSNIHLQKQQLLFLFILQYLSFKAILQNTQEAYLTYLHSHFTYMYSHVDDTWVSKTSLV